MAWGPFVHQLSELVPQTVQERVLPGDLELAIDMLFSR